MVCGSEDRAGHAHHGGVAALQVESTTSTGRCSRPRALADAENTPAIALNGAHDNRADHSVEPGAIAAAGQQAKLLFRHYKEP